MEHIFLKTSCQSRIDPQCFHEYVCLVSLQAYSREWLIFGIADASAIPKIASHGAVNPFPPNLSALLSGEQRFIVLTVRCIVKAYLQKKGTTTMKCTTSAERTRSFCRWHSALRLIPKQPKGVISPSNDSFGRQ